MDTFDRTYVDGRGYEHRYQQHNHDDGSVIVCVYCGAEAPGCDDCPVPPAGDDGAWAEEAARHARGCEWVETRAHQLTPL